jgi:hypothetical protein
MEIQVNLRKVMEDRFPDANLKSYFSFLDPDCLLCQGGV